MNGIEIHTLTVQYVSRKWINYGMIFQAIGCCISHINGLIRYTFSTAGIQYTSHKWLNQGMIFTPLYDESHLNGWIGGVWKVTNSLWNSAFGLSHFMDEWLTLKWWTGLKFIPRPTVQYIPHKWINWGMIFQLQRYHISHVNGWLRYDSPTTGVQ